LAVESGDGEIPREGWVMLIAIQGKPEFLVLILIPDGIM
jgi:hypothetical protein